jgi:hypothetical protein
LLFIVFLSQFFIAFGNSSAIDSKELDELLAQLQKVEKTEWVYENIF